MSKIKINVTPTGFGSWIEIEGKRVEFVRRIDLTVTPKQATVIKLEVVARDGIEIMGEVDRVETEVVHKSIQPSKP